jgi:RNA polymerase sigma-70 factor (ECF subfamily)
MDTSELPGGLPAVAACTSRLEVGSAGEPVADAGAVAAPLDAAPGRAAASLTVPAEWFLEHVNPLWRLVRRLGMPASHIEDIVQEVFIIACRRRADIGEGQVRSFLFGTAVRLCANYRRRAHTRLEVSRDEAIEPSASQAPDAEQPLIAKGWRERLEAALAQLPDAQRTVLVLFELEGLSSPEIAELLSVPLGTVASRLQRARAKFLAAAAELQAAITEQP